MPSNPAAQRTRAPSPFASFSALSPLAPFASFSRPEPRQRPASTPAASPAPAAAAALPREDHRKGAYITGLAENFFLAAGPSLFPLLPLELLRTSGMADDGSGAFLISDEGYYQIIWDLVLSETAGDPSLYLDVNGDRILLAHLPQPASDAGSQTACFSAGDRISLRLGAESDGQAAGPRAQLVLIKLT
ncbi:MAG: hypothetical protein LBJ11_06065 [Oscillospiraceae bacterium]|jgi:hypothetical protein|nr:hypothetical protein [Oscillospiraceae bacterium]